MILDLFRIKITDNKRSQILWNSFDCSCTFNMNTFTISRKPTLHKTLTLNFLLGKFENKVLLFIYIFRICSVCVMPFSITLWPWEIIQAHKPSLPLCIISTR